MKYYYDDGKGGKSLTPLCEAISQVHLRLQADPDSREELRREFPGIMALLEDPQVYAKGCRLIRCLSIPAHQGDDEIRRPIDELGKQESIRHLAVVG